MTLSLMIASCSGPALVRYRNIKDYYYLEPFIIYILKVGNYKYEIPMLRFDGFRPTAVPQNAKKGLNILC
jgi:hypothetical protein